MDLGSRVFVPKPYNPRTLKVLKTFEILGFWTAGVSTTRKPDTKSFTS